MNLKFSVYAECIQGAVDEAPCRYPDLVNRAVQSMLRVTVFCSKTVENFTENYFSASQFVIHRASP